MNVSGFIPKGVEQLLTKKPRNNRPKMERLTKAEQLLTEYYENPPVVKHTNSEEYRLRCLEIASTLKPENGDKLTSQELLDLTDKLLNYIKR